MPLHHLPSSPIDVKNNPYFTEKVEDVLPSIRNKVSPLSLHLGRRARKDGRRRNSTGRGGRSPLAERSSSPSFLFSTMNSAFRSIADHLSASSTLPISSSLRNSPIPSSLGLRFVLEPASSSSLARSLLRRPSRTQISLISLPSSLFPRSLVQPRGSLSHQRCVSSLYSHLPLSTGNGVANLSTPRTPLPFDQRALPPFIEESHDLEQPQTPPPSHKDTER